jgi:hypothetical protein
MHIVPFRDLGKYLGPESWQLLHALVQADYGWLLDEQRERGVSFDERLHKVY